MNDKKDDVSSRPSESSTQCHGLEYFETKEKGEKSYVRNIVKSEL